MFIDCKMKQHFTCICVLVIWFSCKYYSACLVNIVYIGHGFIMLIRLDINWRQQKIVTYMPEAEHLRSIIRRSAVQFVLFFSLENLILSGWKKNKKRFASNELQHWPYAFFSQSFCYAKLNNMDWFGYKIKQSRMRLKNVIPRSKYHDNENQ